MHIDKFIIEKLHMIVLNINCAILLGVFLSFTGNKFSVLFIVFSTWTFVLLGYLVMTYLSQKKKYQELEILLKQIDKCYLFCEVMDKPDNQLEKLYFHILKQGSKEMLEEIYENRKKLEDYKEYIESWIHEIKMPITASYFLCNKDLNPVNQQLQKEIGKINMLVEQALYYARSEVTEHDYYIKQLEINDIIQPALLNNRMLIQENGIDLIIEDMTNLVYTDEKWITFILNQILSNAIKYAREKKPCIRLYSREMENGLELIIEDNGIGISETEISRIFDKGFTGINRNKDKSTGMGLYISKKLCEKLGLGIYINSKLGEYTRIHISFPKGSFTELAR